jgi:uncharacterized tellurite resistance protein B-like protein
MLVVRADRVVRREEVRFVKDYFSNEVLPGELDSLRAVMKTPPREEVEQLVAKIQFRFPGLEYATLLSLLAGIAKSDGQVTAHEAAIIRAVALTLGVPEERWPEIAEALDLIVTDYWGVLGLAPGASPEEVRAAYRKLVLPRISQMTLAAAYTEVTISPVNTGANEAQAAETWRIQWVKHARRRCGSVLTARSSWSSTARRSPLTRDWLRIVNSMKPWD